MTLEEVLKFLEENGSEQTKKVLVRHGAREPFFGVKIADLSRLKKKIGRDHDLALELYSTGNSDAMYLAAMVADPDRVTIGTLDKWVGMAYWYMISDYAVAPLAARSRYAFKVALDWIDSGKEFTESAGWSTLSHYLSRNSPDSEQKEIIRSLLLRAAKSIHEQKNRVKYSMNGFVIACGSFDLELKQEATEAAILIGKVRVDMGGTACKVPVAEEMIRKVAEMGKSGRKRR